MTTVFPSLGLLTSQSSDYLPNLPYRDRRICLIKIAKRSHSKHHHRQQWPRRQPLPLLRSPRHCHGMKPCRACLAASVWLLGSSCWWAHLIRSLWREILMLDIGATVDPQLHNRQCRWHFAGFPDCLAAGRYHESCGYVVSRRLLQTP